VLLSLDPFDQQLTEISTQKPVANSTSPLLENTAMLGAATVLLVLENSAEITAQTGRAPESEPPPTAQPASDPTNATRLTPDFVHLVAGTLVGEFVVEKLLGTGGMGAVYGAKHERLGRRAAIKVISPSLSTNRAAVERFEQEAQALARLSHPGIVSVLGVGTLPGDGRAYYVMEWLDGQSLQDRLHTGPIDHDLALGILDQIARALDAAHAAGIVHRDFKPDNCWLQRVGTEPAPVVKILDLGLAKLAAHTRSERTAVGIMFGTAAYMSPEQCRSARDVGPETDVYALGCVAYELLCGRLPFLYDNFAELVVAHQGETPPRPRQLAPQLNATLDELLLAMLAKEPSQRPTLVQVRATIARRRSAPTIARMRPVPRIAPRVQTVPVVAARQTPQRSRAMLGAGVVVLVVVAILFGARGRTEGHGVTARDGLDGRPASRDDAVGIVDAPGPTVVSVPVVDAAPLLPIDAGIAVVHVIVPVDAPNVNAPDIGALPVEHVPALPVEPVPETPTDVTPVEPAKAIDQISAAPPARKMTPPPPTWDPNALFPNNKKKPLTKPQTPDRNILINPFAPKRAPK
jgi:serine/threonine-protein kinase